MKKLVLIPMFLLSTFLCQTVWADCAAGGDEGHGRKECAMRGDQDEDAYPCPIVDKIMKKAHFFLENKDEIGLSEEQVDTIRGLKLQVKKSLIRSEADMQIMMLDMKAKLGDDTLDVEGIDTMIDQGMGQMAQTAKANVDVYAKLKAVLTPEQVEKAKALWTKKK